MCFTGCVHLYVVQIVSVVSDKNGAHIQQYIKGVNIELDTANNLYSLNVILLSPGAIDWAPSISTLSVRLSSSSAISLRFLFKR